jgi:hypothetical protein
VTPTMPAADEEKRQFTPAYPFVGSFNAAFSRIIEKLESLGYADEIASMDEVTEQLFANLPEVNRQRDLSDRSSSSNTSTNSSGSLHNPSSLEDHQRKSSGFHARRQKQT